MNTSNDRDRFVRDFTNALIERKMRYQRRTGKAPSTAIITEIRTEVREQLKERYPAFVADLDHYHNTNRAYWSANGGVGAGLPKNIDEQWARGAELENALRGRMTSITTTGTKKSPRTDQRIDLRPQMATADEGLRNRYLALVREGYVPNDRQAATLLGVTTDVVAGWRRELSDQYEFSAGNGRWSATPKVDPNTEKLKRAVEEMTPEMRRTILDLLK